MWEADYLVDAARSSFLYFQQLFFCMCSEKYFFSQFDFSPSKIIADTYWHDDMIAEFHYHSSLNFSSCDVAKALYLVTCLDS